MDGRRIDYKGEKITRTEEEREKSENNKKKKKKIRSRMGGLIKF